MQTDLLAVHQEDGKGFKHKGFFKVNECCSITCVRGVSLFCQSILINVSQILNEIQESETCSEEVLSWGICCLRKQQFKPLWRQSQKCDKDFIQLVKIRKRYEYVHKH